MKTQFLNLKVVLSVSLIVLSIAIPVNYQLASMAGAGISQVADGVPLPPPPPNGGIMELADGVPLPPPPPPNGGIIEVADGVPLPPPVTPPPKSVTV